MNIHGKVGAWLLVLFLWCVPEVFAWQFPDTGQTKCYDNTAEIACPAPGQPFYGQDAQYQGPVRFYTKLGENGVALARYGHTGKRLAHDPGQRNRTGLGDEDQ